MTQVPKDDANKVLYCKIMEQLKDRVDIAKGLLEDWRDKRLTLPLPVAAEFILLQLRICCELLALGCVAIHTDVKQPKYLQTQWNAHRIMGKFEQLKPSFFPEGVKTVPVDGVLKQVLVDGALTKDQLTKSYHLLGRCSTPARSNP